jgi:uncharacterized protein (TIGR02246 family)
MDGPNTAAQREVWDVVRRINAAWREGHPERLSELLHDQMVIIGPDGRRFAEGKEPCVASYREFCESAPVTFYQESDPQVDVYETTAVVSYQYEIEYSLEGKVHREAGRDVFVLEKQDGRWLAVWRQLSSQPA